MTAYIDRLRLTAYNPSDRMLGWTSVVTEQPMWEYFSPVLGYWREVHNTLEAAWRVTRGDQVRLKEVANDPA